jgi:hypothetical protein
MINQLTQPYLLAIEEELRSAIGRASGEGMEVFHQMLAYHMGWRAKGPALGSWKTDPAAAGGAVRRRQGGD